MRLFLGITSEDWSVRRLLVKQSYPLKTGGEQSCEAARKSAMQEASRVITSDGTVIRTLLDGSTQVIEMCCDENDCEDICCPTVVCICSGHAYLTKVEKVQLYV